MFNKKILKTSLFYKVYGEKLLINSRVLLIGSQQNLQLILPHQGY